MVRTGQKKRGKKGLHVKDDFSIYIKKNNNNNKKDIYKEIKIKIYI